MSRPMGSKNKPRENGSVAVIEVLETLVQEPIRKTVTPEPPLKIKQYLLETGCHEGADGRWYRLHEPLCFQCWHQSDMHHEWHFVERVVGKRMEVNREKNYEIPKRPCQHACHCWEYK